MNEQTQQTIETRVITRALQDESFKQQLLNGDIAAKAAIEEEIGEKLLESLQVKVLEETSNISYIILPKMPSTEEMSQQQLETVAGGKRISSTRVIAGTSVAGVATQIRLPCTFGSITFK